MIVPVLLYLAFNAGRPSAHGWGAAMSTDTAFALGALALVGRNLPDRVRTYLLTFSVVDDLASIVVIALFYSGQVHVVPLLIGVLLLALEALLRFRGVRFGAVHLLIGMAAWVAVYQSGLDPITVGLVMGLLAYARPAARSDLEQATDLFRLFREQPTAELARDAAGGLQAALSPNDTLEATFHPWTSYVIVPLFALANADIVITGSFLAKAYTSAVTLGILVAYVVGKPLGTGAGAWLVTKLSRGRVRPPIGWAAVAGTGAIAGVGFTVSLLIASLAFRGDALQEAKLGVLTAVLCASGLSWAVFRVTAKLPKRLKILALLGTSDGITDLAVAVDPRRDHLRGPDASPVTVVEYGDFECPYCGQAEPVVRELLGDFGDVRYVWRHLPLTDVHPHAQFAAEAAEAAAAQDAFWPMHDLLLGHQGALTPRDLLDYAGQLELDLNRFRDDLRSHAGAGHVAEDVDSADLSSVSGTPTFFINGMRHYGAYDIDSLSAAVRTARYRALLGEPPVSSHAEQPAAEPVGDRLAREPEPVPEPELYRPGPAPSSALISRVSCTGARLRPRSRRAPRLPRPRPRPRRCRRPAPPGPTRCRCARPRPRRPAARPAGRARRSPRGTGPRSRPPCPRLPPRRRGRPPAPPRPGAGRGTRPLLPLPRWCRTGPRRNSDRSG